MSNASQPEDGARQETEEEARQRRLNALRQLAGTSPQIEVVRPTAPERGTARPTERRRRPWWAIGATVAAAVVVIAGLFLTGVLPPMAPAGKGATTTTTVPLVIAPAESSLLCPQDIAWSPDGSRIAVLGYLQTCFGSPGAYFAAGAPTAELIIYDARNGKQMQTIALDPPLASAFPIAPSVTAAFSAAGAPAPTLHTNFQHVVWLPDGQHLAVLFQSFRPTATAANHVLGGYNYTGDTINGVWLGDAQDENVRLISHVDGGTQINLRSVPFPSVSGWDLTAGTEANVISVGNGGTLPPALSYAWQSDGTIAPQSAFTDATVPQVVPPGPVGGTGAPTFTMWQTGSMGVFVYAPAGKAVPPFAYTYLSAVEAISPDGRYLTPPLSVAGYLEPDGQPANPQAIEANRLSSLPRLPIRDAGQRAVVNVLTGAGSQGRRGFATLAWSADGRYLAAQVAPAAGGVAASSYPVSIYDARSGQLLATLVPSAKGGSSTLINQGLVTTLRWSPDSSHLLMNNTFLGTTTIWGPSQLPHVG